MTGRVALRPARLTDAWRLYKWRTDPLTAAMMDGPPPRSFLAHLGWLLDVLSQFTSLDGSPRRYLYVAHTSGVYVPVGTVRLDARGAEAQVSLTVAPDVRGYGYATCILDAVLREARRLGILRCVAEIKAENEASYKAFRHAGFVEWPWPHVTRPGFVVLTHGGVEQSWPS